MDRIELINSLIKKKNYKNYLEIGVLNGYLFFLVQCKNKIAVDPEFKFGSKEKLRAIKYKLLNIRNKYFQVTSDEFFAKQAPAIYSTKKLDISFVDGMHEFRYVLNDALNSLKYLQDDGVIVLHDCNPQSAEAECSFADWQKRGFTGEWNGDTWKTITYLIKNHPELDVFTTDCDYGLGIITKRKNPTGKISPMSFEEIDGLTYSYLANNREQLLNLKPVSYLKEFFSI